MPKAWTEACLIIKQHLKVFPNQFDYSSGYDTLDLVLQSYGFPEFGSKKFQFVKIAFGRNLEL
jgi:hypothetical protein